MSHVQFSKLILNNDKFSLIVKNLKRNFSQDASSSTSRNRRLYCFGLAEHGALGLHRDSHSKVKKYYKKPIRHYFAEENCLNTAAVGYGFSALSVHSQDTYKVYGCGINSDFQLGLQESTKNLPLDIVLSVAPINLGLKCPNTQVTAMSAGRAHLAVLTDAEGVFLSGSNCYGQCAREIVESDKLSTSFCVHRLSDINDEKITNVCCGQDHTLFITETCGVYSCGWGCDGQTGLGHTNIISEPCRLEGDIKYERIIKLAGQSDCTLALSDKGDVFGWGNNEYNQICEGDQQQVNCPTILKNLNGVGRIVDIAAGGAFCMVLNDCGDVFVWGYGILGGGPELQRSNRPFRIPRTLFGQSYVQPDTKVISISAGLSHLAAINNYGHLYMWGKNRQGCLGIGHTRDQYFPYKVALSALADKVLCGVDHTLVLCSPF